MQGFLRLNGLYWLLFRECGTVKLVAIAKKALAGPKFQVLAGNKMKEESFINTWRELSEHAIVPNPFFDPDFCLPAIDALAKGRISVATVYDGDGVLIALAPIWVSRFAHVGPKTAHIWTHDYILSLIHI